MLTVPFALLAPPCEGSLGFSAEASDIGLAAGEWPDFIAVMRDGDTEGVLFRRGVTITARGEFGGYEYWTASGVRLAVFND